MGRPSKFSVEEKADIYLHIRNYLEYIDEETRRLTISDAEMSNILCTKGYAMSAKYIERIRRSSKILPYGETGGVRPGAGRPSGSGATKFDQATMLIMQQIMKNHTNDSWQLIVSDRQMSDIMNDAGYMVDVKYVERMRRVMGIKALNQKGGYREGAGRPSISASAKNLQNVQLIDLHNAAVAELSYRRVASGALRGQSGVDVYDHYGHHAISFDDAVERKQQQLLKPKKHQPMVKPVLPGSEDVFIESDSRLLAEYVRRIGLARAHTDNNATEQATNTVSLFDEEVNGKLANYGKSGKGGGIQNTRTSQVLSSL